MFTLTIVRGSSVSSRDFHSWSDATMWAFHAYNVDVDILIGCESKGLMVHRSPGGKMEWLPV